MGFTHLHLHTEYSLLDGACRLDRLLDRAAELGQKSIAITDHGVMYGAVDFYKKAKAKGIKPIIGCECYVAARSRRDKVHSLDSERYHLVLLCKNETGYKNLIKMLSLAWTEGFYVKPRIDRELLERYSDGLIALSACLAGEIPGQLQNGDYEGAKQTAMWYSSVFGEGNFYLELQNHGLREQAQIEPLLIRLSRETGIPLVATNDTHYINKEDSKVQKILICIATNTTLNDENALDFKSDEFYLKSEDEMRGLFQNVPEAVDNTEIIAEKCNFDFEFGNTKLPHFEVPDGRDHFEYFRDECRKGMYRRYGENPPAAYFERLDYELEIIDKMGYTDYFLIVNDFISFAKSKGIPVGPGRGSGAGSIAAYCVGITGIDPMRYSLLFERFLNPERVSMPDIDVDFCYERRSEVIDYVINKYGADHVAQIVTFGTLAPRAAVRDVGRAMGLPYSLVDSVSKKIPRDLDITLEKALKRAPDFREMYESDEQIKELVDLSASVEGMPRHTSTHAAGVVITRDPVSEYVPLSVNDNSPVTQYTMTTLEELGLLKMDFLGLRTLTVISDAEREIRKTVPGFDINTVDLNDSTVFEMLSEGRTDGVFQFESAGMKNVLSSLKPHNIEDLIAVISLYRPGPMDSIQTYIHNRHFPQDTVYRTEKLRDILEVTNGCMVYQEQVMQIFRSLAGYSFGRADIVRRAMSKKKKDVMEKERHNFIYGLENEDGSMECEGCIRRGVDEKTANEIFDDMSSFASYAFNKSHAAAYAYVAYQTAYLKCHYPGVFMAALLTSVLGNTDKIAAYTAECSRLSIKVMPPHVNESLEGFTFTGEFIRYGMLAIKNLGRGMITKIIDERKKNRFSSFYDFCSRMYGSDFNRRAVESLIKSGALDGLGLNRREMMLNAGSIIDDLENRRRRNIEGQIGLFELLSDESELVSAQPETVSAEEFPWTEFLAMEKEVTGLYMSGHPMLGYAGRVEELGFDKISDIKSDENAAAGPRNERVRIIGIITSVKKKTTKSDTTMAFITVEDVTGSIEVIVFPNCLLASKVPMLEGSIIAMTAKIDSREDEQLKLICETLVSVDEADTLKNSRTVSGQPRNSGSKTKKKVLYLKVPSESAKETVQAEKLIAVFEGSTPVRFFYCDKMQYSSLPCKCFVSENEPLLNELKRLLGSDNVVFR